MSTKKIATLFAALTVVILATIGVAYGAWTQQLNVNGTVGTGTFDVHYQGFYYDYDVPGCTATISPDNLTLNITISNAYPGYQCNGGATIKNFSSIPAKIHGLVQTSNNVPATFHGADGLVYMTDGSGNVVLPGGSFVLGVDTSPTAHVGGVMWNFSIPASETGHQGETYSFSYTIAAEQSAP